MILGIPAITFIAFIIQPILIILAFVWAKKYDKIVKLRPFAFLKAMDDEIDEMEKQEKKESSEEVIK